MDMEKMTDRQSREAGPVDSAAERPDGQLSRRRFTGAGLAAPVILSLASRPAFGAICTPSGFVSYSPNNPSGVRHVVDGCGGLSPGAWKNPYAGNGDGSFRDWLAAGYLPNDPDEQPPNAGAGNNTSGIRRYKRDNPGPYVPTLFTDAFGGYGPSGLSMHDVLLDLPGSLEFHAAATLLNAASGIPGYMSPSTVINLYIASFTGTYSSGGTTIDMSTFDLKAFFEQTYH